MILGHRDLTSEAFVIALANGAPEWHELFVDYESPAGRARVVRTRTGPNAYSYSVSFEGTVLATVTSLTLAALDALVGFTSEPLTTQEQIDALDARIDVLEMT